MLRGGTKWSITGEENKPFLRQIYFLFLNKWNCYTSWQLDQRLCSEVEIMKSTDSDGDKAVAMGFGRITQ